MSKSTSATSRRTRTSADIFSDGDGSLDALELRPHPAQIVTVKPLHFLHPLEQGLRSTGTVSVALEALDERTLPGEAALALGDMALRQCKVSQKGGPVHAVNEQDPYLPTLPLRSAP